MYYFYDVILIKIVFFGYEYVLDSMQNIFVLNI